jgi:hypothetical protein
MVVLFFKQNRKSANFHDCLSPPDDPDPKLEFAEPPSGFLSVGKS